VCSTARVPEAPLGYGSGMTVDLFDSVVPMEVEYVLPLRWPADHSERDAAELGAYLAWLAERCAVTVVDGSEPAVFERHARLWGGLVRHISPAPWPSANGKVAGVVTGVRTARHERVLIADDDVRYSEETLRAVVAGLHAADLVRPQNVFTHLPWHARWDTGRTLLNRCWGVDYPGTHAVRRSTFLAMGGYDGDVMFENIELARTVAAHGGRVLDLPHVFVPRRPPTARHFWSQRVRQAYDSLAQPQRLAVELSLAPLMAVTAVRAPRLLAACGAVAVALAEVGRRRAGGTAAYPRSAALWSVPWVLERSVCSWLAVLARARGGVRYGGHRIRRAAASQRELERLLPLRVPLAPVRLDALTPARHAGR
jgi:hypothetical protein